MRATFSPILIASLISCGLSSPSFASPNEGVLLRWNWPTDKVISYKLNRVCTTDGKKQRSYDFLVNVSAQGSQRGSDETELKVSPFEFSGQDATNPKSKHFKDIAGAVHKMNLYRTFSPFGPKGLWQFPADQSGWVGMEVRRAIGFKEVGFLELHFPQKRLRVGETWQVTVNMDVELSTPGETRGNFPKCTYKLVSFDPKSGQAKISFSVKTTVIWNYPDLTDNSKLKQSSVPHTNSGSWIINTRTGLPVKFENKLEFIWGTENSIFTTTVQRFFN